MKKVYWLIKKFILVLPLLLAIIGYVDIYPGQYFDALYFGLRLYGFSYDINEVTFLLEIARWMAPVVLITTVVLTIQSLATKLNNTIKFHLYHPMVIYGQNILCEMFCEDIDQQNKIIPTNKEEQRKNKIRYIRSEKVLPAQTHVIMFENDQENLRFFARNIEALKGTEKIRSSVYIQLEDFNDHMFNHEGIDVYPFSISYTIAQLYWRSQCEELCNLVYLNKPIEIAILGQGIYAQKIVEEGLLFNIYGLQQEIIYHVYGDWKEFKNSHLYWQDIESATSKEVKDKVIFHEDEWFEHIQEFNNYQKIIICDDRLEKNLHITHIIKGLVANNDSIDVMLFDHDMFSQDTSSFNRIQFFGDYHQACTYDIVIQERLIAAAKQQHANYNENERRMNPLKPLTDWYNLSNFLRNSNTASSNFTLHNLEHIKKHISNNDDVAQLEHIRWARYHYLNNWQVGPRDNNARRHPDLIEYDALSREEKDKDLQAKGLKRE